MADTKKGGNSIVWSWREVAVENCTCMSVEAGMYCGPERTPGIANDSPVESSCGHHCWDLGYINTETGYFISKGFPVCGGPDAPPTPDPIAWAEFPTLTDLNTDGVPPCQRRATGLAFMRQAGLQSELQQVVFENAVIQEPVIRTSFPPTDKYLAVRQHRTIVYRPCGIPLSVPSSCPCSSPVGTQVPPARKQGCPAGSLCIAVEWTDEGGTKHVSDPGCVITGKTGGTFPYDNETDPHQQWWRINEHETWGEGTIFYTQAY